MSKRFTTLFFFSDTQWCDTSMDIYQSTNLKHVCSFTSTFPFDNTLLSLILEENTEMPYVTATLEVKIKILKQALPQQL